MMAEEKPASADATADQQKKIKPKKEDLSEKFAECEKKREEYLAGWQRARADFLNYKKEEMERAGALVFYSQTEMILRILPILDDFEKADRETSEILKNHQCEELEQSIKGFLQIKKQIQELLKNYKVEEMKIKGEKFDPNFAEVVEEVDVKDKEQGTIIEEIQKGYTLQGKVIRPARVKVVK